MQFDKVDTDKDGGITLNELMAVPVSDYYIIPSTIQQKMYTIIGFTIYSLSQKKRTFNSIFLWPPLGEGVKILHG